MLIGVIGFIASNNTKSEYEIFVERFSGEKMHQAEIFTKVTHDYQFYFWGVDEKFESEHGFAEFSGEFKIVDKNNNTLLDTAFSVGSSTSTNGGIERAQSGFYFYYSPPKDMYLTVDMNIVVGDYVDLEVHEDLPQSVALKPPLFIFIFVVGIFIFLRKKQKQIQ